MIIRIYGKRITLDQLWPKVIFKMIMIGQYLSLKIINRVQRDSVSDIPGVPKIARIRGTVHCCFVVKICFSWVSDKTGNRAITAKLGNSKSLQNIAIFVA